MAFNDVSVSTDIVFLAVLWRRRYKLSLRDLAEMVLERGFVFSHETGRQWERPIASFDTPVMLFDHVILVLATAVDHLGSQDLADGRRVGVVPVGGHFRGSVPDDIKRLGKEPLGRLPVAVEHRTRPSSGCARRVCGARED